MFERLGDCIKDAYARVNYNEDRLPEIAAEFLEKQQLPVESDMGHIARFLLSTEIEQTPKATFSDLPVIVYRGGGFYIQLLVWQKSTTAIHHHAFSGAFKVVHGSSIHSRYTFEEQDRISSKLVRGRAKLDSIELLERGAIHQIVPGKQGLLHALFHIDEPSITVVVRTPYLAWALPQYQIAKPHFAWDERELGNDDRVRVLSRVLPAMRGPLGDTHLVDFMVDQVACLDFPRVFALHREIEALLPDEADRKRFLDALRDRHGEDADRLADVIRNRTVEASLINTRYHTADRDLRFFLAVLLNAPDATAVHQVIGQRHPGQDPLELCAEWVARLGDPETLLDAIVASRTVRRKSKPRKTLIPRLTDALPKGLSNRATIDFVRELLDGTAPEDLATRLATRHPDAGISGRGAELEAAGLSTRELPELGPLMVDR